MPVHRLELSSIDAKRYSRPNERHAQIQIQHNSTVTLVKAIAEKEATIEFRYTASYGPIGIITIEGSLVYACDAQDFEAKWRATQQMPVEAASEIHSTVMRVCVPQAVGVAKDLQLPPPIPLPQVNFQQPQKSAAASVPGPEIM